MYRFLVVLMALAAAPLAAAPDAPSPILTAPEARDILSYAQPAVARVTHVDLDLTADFSAKTMRGTAALDILAAPGAQEIVLDDKGLVIERIADAGANRCAGRSARPIPPTRTRVRR